MTPSGGFGPFPRQFLVLWELSSNLPYDSDCYFVNPFLFENIPVHSDTVHFQAAIGRC